MGIFLSGPVVQGIKVGDIIIAKRERDKGDGKHFVLENAEYKVTHVSRHTVTAVRDKGREKRVFSYGDLVMNGLQPQYRSAEEAFITDTKKGARHKYNKKGGKQNASGSV